MDAQHLTSAVATGGDVGTPREAVDEVHRQVAARIFEYAPFEQTTCSKDAECTRVILASCVAIVIPCL
jgi:hypothetical protein